MATLHTFHVPLNEFDVPQQWGDTYLAERIYQKFYAKKVKYHGLKALRARAEWSKRWKYRKFAKWDGEASVFASLYHLSGTVDPILQQRLDLLKLTITLGDAE